MNYHQLITLNAYLNDREMITRNQIAKVLNLSFRQTTRKLKEWSENGIIEYDQGVGRGNGSKIKILIDIEQQFLNEFLTNIKNYTPIEINEILKLPLSETVRQIIVNTIHNEIYDEEKKKKLVYSDYIYHIPTLSKNGMIYDSNMQTIINNCCLRLFERGQNEYQSYLVKHYDITDQQATFYLYKNVYFSNGFLMTSRDVVDCLKSFLESKLGGLYKNIILEITSIDTFSFKITYIGQFEIVQFILSDLTASIYKIIDQKFYSVGPYYAEVKENKYIKLIRNPFFNAYHFEIDEVFLINDINMYINHYNLPNKITIGDYKKYRFLLAHPMTKLSKVTCELFREDINNILEDNVINEYRNKTKIKITFIENVDLKFGQIIKQLNNIGYEIEIEIIPAAEFFKMDISKLVTNYVYMTELLFAKMDIFDLFINSIAGDWFDKEFIEEKILNPFINTNNRKWDEVNAVVEKGFFENGTIIPLYSNTYEWVIANGYTVTEPMRYGNKDYSKFIQLRH
ncbi:hypothetical protein [Macrococcus capreoli]|uniref:hypothetical protein n=1 Tax=Macrococcus capreoli TaxID=2982690 RepID=UPI003EE7C32A